MRSNDSIWREALKDLKLIDLIMILILIFAVVFCWYVRVHESDNKHNLEELK